MKIVNYKLCDLMELCSDLHVISMHIFCFFSIPLCEKNVNFKLKLLSSSNTKNAIKVIGDIFPRKLLGSIGHGLLTFNMIMLFSQVYIP